MDIHFYIRRFMAKEFVNVNLQIKFNNFTIFNNWLNLNVNEVLQNLPLTK